MEPRYVIGIDLGTTNSALAYAEVIPDADPFAPANVQLLAIPQLTNPGEVRDEDLLPSFLYLPGPSDFPQGSLAPPDKGRYRKFKLIITLLALVVIGLVAGAGYGVWHLIKWLL